MPEDVVHPDDATFASSWMVRDGLSDFSTVTDSFARLLGDEPLTRIGFRDRLLARSLMTSNKPRDIRTAVRNLVRSALAAGYHANIDLPSGSRVSPLAHLSARMEEAHIHLRLSPFDTSIERHVEACFSTAFTVATEMALRARAEHLELLRDEPNDFLGIGKLLGEPTFVYHVVEPAIHALLACGRSTGGDLFEALELSGQVTKFDNGDWSLTTPIDLEIDPNTTAAGDLCGILGRAITQLSSAFEVSDEANLWWLGGVAPTRHRISSEELSAATEAINASNQAA